MPKRKSYWDEWQEAAEGYFAGRQDEPPDPPPTLKVLALLHACREVDRLLRDPKSTVSMPATAKRIRNALGDR